MDPDQPVPGSDHARPDLLELHGLGAAELLDILGRLPAQSVAGVDPTDDALQVYLSPIGDDPRGTVAGLFGLTAPPSWQAVAVCAGAHGPLGELDHDDGLDVDGDVEIRALLTRTGELCTRVTAPGGDGVEQLGAGDARPTGLLVDTMHRILGLPTPGEPPDPTDVALGIWAQSLLVALFEDGDLAWTDAVTMHPGAAVGPRRVPHRRATGVVASIETLVEATFRATDDWDWRRIHRRASSGSAGAELSAREAAWMDTTMYGRWVVSHLADPIGVAELLDSQDFGDVAAGLRAVVEGVDRARDPLSAA